MGGTGDNEERDLLSQPRKKENSAPSLACGLLWPLCAPPRRGEGLAPLRQIGGLSWERIPSLPSHKF